MDCGLNWPCAQPVDLSAVGLRKSQGKKITPPTRSRVERSDARPNMTPHGMGHGRSILILTLTVTPLRPPPFSLLLTDSNMFSPPAHTTPSTNSDPRQLPDGYITCYEEQCVFQCSFHYYS